MTGVVLDRISSYLSQREQRVFIQDTSRIHHQGSTIGPLLFICYTAPIQNIIHAHGFSTMIYADDTQSVADLGGGGTAGSCPPPPFETFFYKCPPFLYMCPPPPFEKKKKKKKKKEKKRCLIPPGYTPVATYPPPPPPPPPPPRRRWRSGKKSVGVPPAYQLFCGTCLAAVRKKQNKNVNDVALIRHLPTSNIANFMRYNFLLVKK